MQTLDVVNDQPQAPQQVSDQHLRTHTPNHSRRQARGLRWTFALLATGSYALLAGGVLLLPFALSPNAIQNDVYLGNYVLGPVLLVGGALSLLVGLLRLARSHAQDADVQGHRLGLFAQALVLAVMGAAAVVFATFTIGGRYTSVGPNAPTWPPYLDPQLLAVTLCLGVVVWAASWVWAWEDAHGTRAPTAPSDGTSRA